MGDKYLVLVGSSDAKSSVNVVLPTVFRRVCGLSFSLYSLLLTRPVHRQLFPFLLVAGGDLSTKACPLE